MQLGQEKRYHGGRLLYGAKGMPEKALEHYETFVELWKNADPELQSRVRDVRGRIERLRAVIAKKG